jgi:hypothetical protein
MTMVTVREYARVNGLTEEHVIALIQEGQLSGKKIDGEWHVFPSLPLAPARPPQAAWYGLAAGLALAILLFALNPNQEAHVERLQRELAQASQAEQPGEHGAWARISRKLAATLDLIPLLAELEYRDYGVASVTRNDQGIMTIGVLGKVFVVGEP